MALNLSHIPRELCTVLIAMLPIFELRGAIPYALGRGMSWQQAYFFSVVGNSVPVIPLLLFLEPVSNLLSRRYPHCQRFFGWLFARTRRRGRLVERYEALGLILFVAIPLPVTGAWTGTVATFLFGVRFKYALPAIILGILLAGTVVTLASLGVITLWTL
ncbi:MAG: hypothetical protein AMJ92_00650 [candidate division Zixibacteria bacterium SM23_81]|nr:MAG: hypothetical protein AMJ92_00650 [candidate division Zixibacteria bacterium SM23_81]